MSIFDKIKNSANNVMQKVGTAFKKTPTESQFQEKGTLTPLEFELAGDQLIAASPIWEWKKAIKKSYTKKELSVDKQFLSATIYSNERLKDLIIGDEGVEGEVDESGFIALKTRFDEIEGNLNIFIFQSK